MKKEIKEEIKQMRIKQAIGKPIYKNINTNKNWFLMSAVTIGGVYEGYISYHLMDSKAKTLTVPDYRFDKFYKRV